MGKKAFYALPGLLAMAVLITSYFYGFWERSEENAVFSAWHEESQEDVIDSAEDFSFHLSGLNEAEAKGIAVEADEASQDKESSFAEVVFSFFDGIKFATDEGVFMLSASEATIEDGNFLMLIEMINAETNEAASAYPVVFDPKRALSEVDLIFSFIQCYYTYLFERNPDVDIASATPEDFTRHTSIFEREGQSYEAVISMPVFHEIFFEFIPQDKGFKVIITGGHLNG